MSPDDEALVEAQRREQEETERRLGFFYAKRPPVFAIKGQLDSGISAWLDGMWRGDGTNLLLGGDVGSTKTWSSWKCVETLLFNAWRGGWEITNAYALSRLIAPPVDEEELDRLARLDLLVIDDLGSMKVTEWAGAHMYGLIDYRWSHLLPTVITTNVEDLDEVVGPRIASRLADRITSIGLGGPDLRRVK